MSSSIPVNNEKTFTTTFYNKDNKDKTKHYFDEDLLLLDLERIRIFISVLEEHEENCEKEERFPEASITRDKIKLLRDVEEIKIFNDLSNYHSQQVSQIFFIVI
jgi:hypothetical protein